MKWDNWLKRKKKKEKKGTLILKLQIIYREVNYTFYVIKKKTG